MTNWSPALIDQRAVDLCRTAGLPAPQQRTAIREWELCSVHRLHLPDRTLILKLSRPPFTTEHASLAALAAVGVPVPEVHAYHQHADVTGMLLTDLGPALHAPSHQQTAAAAATHLHRPDPLPGHPTINDAALRDTAAQGLTLIDQAHAAGTIPNPGQLHRALKRLDRLAARRARDTDRPPYGICHGELHPTALHISQAGQHILDVPLTHTGPGLLDLASILGARTVNIAAMNMLITSYVQAQGHRDAHANRAGLDPARWALGWHRAMSALWHLQQLATGTNTGHDLAVANRQLHTAIQLLE